MNFNQSIRQAIVSSVIDDIPRKHKDAAKKIQDIVDSDVTKYAPKEIASIWNTPDLACYLSISSSNAGYSSVDKSYSACDIYPRMPSKHEISDGARKKISAILSDVTAEAESIAEARKNLTSALAGIRTCKQFVAAFPELEKYAPSEHITSRMVPAIANVMAGLSKLGWTAGAAKTAEA